MDPEEHEIFWDVVRIYADNMQFVLQTIPKIPQRFTAAAVLTRTHGREILDICDCNNVIIVRVTDKMKLRYSHSLQSERNVNTEREVKNCRELFDLLKRHCPWLVTEDWKLWNGKKVGFVSLREQIQAREKEVNTFEEALKP